MTAISIMPALTFLLAKGRDDLSVRQLFVLIECAAGDQTVRGLAAHVGLNKPAVTRAADRLAELGMLKRRADPADRRSIFMSLTPAGKKFAGNFAQ